MIERKVTTIPVVPTFQHLRKVGVYCRVSSARADQLHSMSAQASHLTKTVLNCRSWQLIDIYLDFRSGLDDNRPELQRLIKDCKDGVIDTILTKSVSRFGRNTAETISLLRELRAIDVRVIFENEEIDTSKYESEFLITLIEAFAQEESCNRSENILWGLEKGMKDGTSKLYNRRCFGYRKNENGDLEICHEEAEIVRLIFDLYLQGGSILSIINELENKEILTPSGKKKWCKQTVVKILNNEKYIGNVLLKKTYTDGFPNRKRKKNSGEKHQYLAEQVHPEIISKEIFDAVQEERQRRSNVVIDENGIKKRASKRYCSNPFTANKESKENSEES
ncbi:MAG: recombinase family protein [Ruminococcus flavefaciens]|nr:recombinase family protein [Ruminococcus flavefaciens]